MRMKDWAKKEVEIASAKERVNAPADEFDYGCACYDSALKAYNSLCEEYKHSGASIRFTKFILDRLIDVKPLTPIEDVPEVWNDIADISGGGIRYQCNRMPSLFKNVFPDGHIEYDDVDRCYCQNKDNPDDTYSMGMVDRFIQKMFPITMPYYPASESIKVITSECLTDAKNGDVDTMAIWYCILPEGKKVEINRFFKDNNTGHGWKETPLIEYRHRVALDAERRRLHWTTSNMEEPNGGK